MAATRSLLLGLCLVLFASMAHAAESYYMKVEGSKQGEFKGTITRNGSRWSQIIAFSMGVESPRDAATGQASGKRQHKPIVIRKGVDAASPEIFRAVQTNEALKQVVIQSIRPGPRGQEQVYQTITLKNAFIARANKIAGKGKPEEEEISITYQQIEVTDIQGKKTATDNWVSSK